MDIVYAKHQSLVTHIRQHETDQAERDINEHIDRIIIDLAALRAAILIFSSDGRSVCYST